MATWKRLTIPGPVPAGEPTTNDVNMEMVCYMVETAAGGTRLYFSIGSDKELYGLSYQESISEIHSMKSL
jgi:hypothetical protein